MSFILNQKLEMITGFPHGSVSKESACNAGDPCSIPGLGRSGGEDYPLYYSWVSFVAQLVKNLPAMWEILASVPGLGRPPGEGKGYPLQYSGLENSMDCMVQGVAKSEMIKFSDECILKAKIS